MTVRLNWEDLVIGDLSDQTSRQCLGYWCSWVQGRIAPLFMSKFGDWFLRHPDGSTSELSVLEGTHDRIAASPGAFSTLLKSQSWQEEHLLSLLVSSLHERGIVPGKGECYGFAPHPILTGRIDLDHVMIMPIEAWQSICAQTIGGPAKGEASS